MGVAVWAGLRNGVPLAHPFCYGVAPKEKPLAPRAESRILLARFFHSAPLYTMSQHRSLRSSAAVGSKRSVLKRGERIKLLKARGEWKEGRLLYNLPKTKPE